MLFWRKYTEKNKGFFSCFLHHNIKKKKSKNQKFKPFCLPAGQVNACNCSLCLNRTITTAQRVGASEINIFSPTQNTTVCAFIVFLSKYFTTFLSIGKGCPKSIFSHHKHTSLNLLGINVEGCHLPRISWGFVSTFFQAIKQNCGVLSTTELTEC